MRALALDLGKSRVGLAVSDELGLMAHPRPFLNALDVRRLITLIKRIVESEQITHVIIGVPYTLKGEEGPGARRSRAFADALIRAEVQADIAFVDERLSTREASLRLREQGLDAKEQRTRIDSAAAAILLQNWLDAQRDRNHG